ncbi:helix-turn-helix domain-containing protein [Paenibacillus sp. TH7-28]
MIRIKLDVVMAQRKMSLTRRSQLVGITQANLSILKNENGKAFRSMIFLKEAASYETAPSIFAAA